MYSERWNSFDEMPLRMQLNRYISILRTQKGTRTQNKNIFFKSTATKIGPGSRDQFCRVLSSKIRCWISRRIRPTWHQLFFANASLSSLLLVSGGSSSSLSANESRTMLRFYLLLSEASSLSWRDFCACNHSIR